MINLCIDIATAPTCRATTWHNKRTTWGDLVAALRDTKRTAETVKQYAALSKDRQGSIKDVGGFVGGYLRDGKRGRGSVAHRQVVALDVDFGGLDAWEAFCLLDRAGVMYSTHKHTPESPRYRIVFPLSRNVKPGEYEAVARVVASWLGIDHFDDTTYQPSRLMYYPSTPTDGEYLFECVDAQAIDPDEVLAELADWQDVTAWPVSSRVTEVKRSARDSKVEDPTTKGGIVGAFCRAFTLEEAIAEFLAEVYAPCLELGPDRYSYVGGSTAGGLVVYGGLHAYSHHSSDPAGDHLSNAFDLVRLHLFGELDAKVRTGDPVVKLPSYKAMVDFAAKRPEVKREIIQERADRAADDYDEPDTVVGREKADTPAAKVGEWVARLETDGGGRIKSTIDNVVIILSCDDTLKGRFGFNEFEQREVAASALPWDRNVPRYPRPLADRDDAELRLYLEKCYGVTGKGQITDGLTVVVHANSFHPVRDYLDVLEWDGVERLDSLFIDLFGADDTSYVRAVTRKAFCAAVARIYTPGCKFDYVTVIIGEQGIGKSTALARMGRGWFSDSMATLEGKEALEQIQGSWIIELGELASMKKAQVEATKHFISKTEDRYRVAYGKRLEHFPRRCVFFGTTNEEDFLRDVTGNRRFWVVNCKGRSGTANFNEYLTDSTVAKLWAEAKERLTQGEALYLAEVGLEEEARDIQDQHLEKDERSGLIREYLDRTLPVNWPEMDVPQRRMWLADGGNVGSVTRDTVCLLEVWSECLGKDPNSITRRDSFEIGRILKGFRDWRPYGGTLRFKNYGNQKAFRR